MGMIRHRGWMAMTCLVLASVDGNAHWLGHDRDEDARRGDPVAEHGTARERVRTLIDDYHISGNDHLLQQGWELLEPGLENETTDPATLLAAAWLAQAGHDFDRARSYLRHVLLLRPDSGEAWLLLASVALVQGDVATARDACSRTTLMEGCWAGCTGLRPICPAGAGSKPRLPSTISRPWSSPPR